VIVISKHILSVLVENQPGVLSKVSGLFSRRGYNIDSLTVGITEDNTISRMTIVLDGDAYILTIEITGDEQKIDAFINLMKPYGIKEIIRTGLTALERGNKSIEIKQ
jgi:acetolactate synthase-1/3 small subunit